MGRLLTYLEDRGVLENAWVIITSDHGDFAGEKGFFTKSESAYECLLHVPLVIRGPGGRWHPGRQVDSLVELIDLFSTILGAAGVAPPPQAQGHDLIAWLDRQGETEPLRDITFSAVGAYGGYLKTTFPHGFAESGRRKGIVRAARSQDFVFIRDPDTGDEAYDLRRDPLELTNLLQPEAGMAPELPRLEEKLAAWERDCAEHARKLGVVPGARNFDEPVKPTGFGMI
jgi:arylsulfatase A-like enzyme